MIEQIGNALVFYAFYTTLGIGQTGLTVSVDVYKNGLSLLSNQAASEVGGGIYMYTLASGSVDAEGEYIAIFKTVTVTVDQQHLPALWVVEKAGVENLNAPIATVDTVVDAIKAKTDNLPTDPADESLLEAAIATRLAAGDYVAPDNANIALIKAKTDLIPANPAAVSDIPTAAEIDAQLSGTHGAGSWGGAGGSGSTETTVTINVDGLPRDGVDVWVTTDEEGVNVVASGVTDDSGNVTFMLDDGSYFVWKQLAGVNFTNPESMVVT